MTPSRLIARRTGLAGVGLLLIVLAACSDPSPVGPSVPAANLLPRNTVAALRCTVQRGDAHVQCENAAGTGAGGASRDVFGTQHVDVSLTSSNVSYDAGTEIFQFDVTVQNLMNETIGTPGELIYGTPLADPAGVRVFFVDAPTVTAGTGTITVANADGTGTFTATNQPYFQYSEILAQNAVSSAKTWQLNVPATVQSFTFVLCVAAEVRPSLVINEVLANPGGTISDANGEWFEVYNAGSRAVDLQTILIADSAASGRRPYWVNTTTPYVLQPGAYVVYGATTNTTLNGGVPVDIPYGAALALANSLDAVKLARVFGTDTVTIDHVKYAQAAISAQNGIARELKNPALDNLNMDGSNWGDASVTAVYGPGGRGTPKAQNSVYVP